MFNKHSKCCSSKVLFYSALLLIPLRLDLWEMLFLISSGVSEHFSKCWIWLLSTELNVIWNYSRCCGLLLTFDLQLYISQSCFFAPICDGAGVVAAVSFCWFSQSEAEIRSVHSIRLHWCASSVMLVLSSEIISSFSLHMDRLGINVIAIPHHCWVYRYITGELTRQHYRVFLFIHLHYDSQGMLKNCEETRKQKNKLTVCWCLSQSPHLSAESKKNTFVVRHSNKNLIKSDA